MSKPHRAYLKAPQVVSIIEQDGLSCEQKLESIKNLLDGKKLSVLPSGQDVQVPSAVNTTESISETPSHVDDILSGISGVKEKQLATIILNEIDRSNYVSYDKENYELIISNEQIKFSNVKNLIAFCVNSSPGALPIGLCLFIDCLMKIRCPLETIRHGDCQALRESLIKINEIKQKTSVESSTENVESNGNEAQSNENVVTISDNTMVAPVEEQTSRGKKRAREEDAEGEDTDLAPPKRSFGLQSNKLDSIRRSSRLKSQIDQAWRSSSTPSARKKKQK